MILRMVRGRIVPGRHSALRAGLAASLSQIRDLDGIVQVNVGLRPSATGNEFAMVTTWTTADAAVAAFGRNVDRVAMIPGITEHLDVHTVEHFELDESIQVQHDQPRTILRVALGTIELGGDVEIQQELRQRVSELGDDVVEVYVGRRIRDTMVEIAFITVWSREPVERPLDQPVFPDVADRYRSYTIEVYDEVYRC